MLNRIDFKGCCEKSELLERVQRLWDDRKNCPGKILFINIGQFQKMTWVDLASTKKLKIIFDLMVSARTVFRGYIVK